MTSNSVHSYWIKNSGKAGGEGVEKACFPFWSFTKTAISICALKLVEEKLLNLDKELHGEVFSLQHLLKHSSGLPDYGTLAEYHSAVSRADEPWPRKKLLKTTLAQGVRFAPGEGWSYSNIGYLLIREMIEDVTGGSLADAISNMISKPLGLSSVAFWNSQEQSALLHWDAARSYHPGWVYHGCLVGTAPDASRILAALFQGEILKPDTLSMMLDRHVIGGPVSGRPWSECGYGLGLMSGMMDGVGRAIGHSGGGPFSVNAVYHFPDLADPMTVACFTNGTDEGIAEHAAVEIAHHN